MIPKLAWKNVWRSRTRSLVVMSAVAIGIWALLFLLSFSQGFVATYISDTIENQTSHVQIHNKEFKKDKEVKYFIEDSDELMASLASNDQIEKATLRSLANGMIATAKGARGVGIRGINPEEEAAVTKLNEKVFDGKYLTDEGRNPILIGKTLAEKLKTKLRKKVVLTFTDAKGEQIQKLLLELQEFSQWVIHKLTKPLSMCVNLTSIAYWALKKADTKLRCWSITLTI